MSSSYTLTVLNFLALVGLIVFISRRFRTGVLSLKAEASVDLLLISAFNTVTHDPILNPLAQMSYFMSSISYESANGLAKGGIREKHISLCLILSVRFQRMRWLRLFV